MGLGQSLFLYLLAGIGVAGADYVVAASRPGWEQGFRFLTAVLFWPLYLPVLLAGAPRVPAAAPAGQPARDGLDVAIARVDAELEAALGSLDGWAEDVLTRERGRIRELRAAWTAQAERIREMDRLLAVPAAEEPDDPAGVPEAATNERIRHSALARRQNLERLRRVRQSAHDDLLATLAWVRELVSMIHLAKFTGAPAARAEELVAQIAAAIEGLSETLGPERPEALGEEPRRLAAVGLHRDREPR